MNFKSFRILDKIVLGTAQFGLDYGIVNVSGKPDKYEVFNILEFAWESGVRCFDTAPSYESETLLGEFIATNSLSNEAILFTKIPSLREENEFESSIRSAIESSLLKLGCKIEVLFFHDPKDSWLLQNDPLFFKQLLKEYPVSALGISVYEPNEVEKLSNCEIELAFQFPFNVLDRRFEKITMPTGVRYARSVFLQGLLASTHGLRPSAPVELLKFQKHYHSKVADQDLNPVELAISFVANSDCVDYFLVGVKSKKQLMDILNREFDISQDLLFLEPLITNTPKKWLDPRSWS